MAVAVGLLLTSLLLTACASPRPAASTPEPTTGMSFDAYLEAHRAYIECLEPFGARMTEWTIREDLGQPEVSYAIQWPDDDLANMTDQEIQNVIDETSSIMDTCESEHLAAAQANYWSNPEAETLRRLSVDERWERSMPAILDCFAGSGIPVDPDATRSEIAAQFEEIDDPLFAACVIETEVFVDLGGGMWEFEY